MAVITDGGDNHFLGTYITPEGVISNQLTDLMDDAVGADNNAANVTGSEAMIAWRPDDAGTSEVFTDTPIGTVVTSPTAAENARFAQFLGGSATTADRFGYIRNGLGTGSTGGTDLIVFDVASTSETPLDKTSNWASASDKSLGMFSFDDTNNYHFHYAGILNNSPGYVFPTNVVMLTLGSVGGTTYGYALRPSATSGTGIQAIVLDSNAEYSVVCSNGATIPTVTELYFRDDNAGLSYPAVGYGDNIFFGRGSFVVGNPYFIESVDGANMITSDPVLGSSFRFAICVGFIGSDAVLMRVGE